ncbi:hypothetical protein C5U37_05160 [Escherichia fergusonii]|nr:hypothetical protein DKG79_10660 [Escherichia fergusonii]EGC94692.1 hypothetical protein ECD227_0930 [Escherichia fergusonii ECD227]PQI93943.1 hypothetical protein C5U38_23815 [Escherichia fergusonii]PQJ01668.1 hypothetical protein C5U37_05160 [Escherichia fergusonii]
MLFFSSSNVFAKQQRIVKAKHRFLVQHARYSLRTVLKHHIVATLIDDLIHMNYEKRNLIDCDYCTNC